MEIVPCDNDNDLLTECQLMNGRYILYTTGNVISVEVNRIYSISAT